jgi:predicted ATPase/DNA-binding CsgD family transcriptional regulator
LDIQDKRYVLPAFSEAQPGQIPARTLPAPLTSLIGREQEVQAVCRLLQHSEVRLVTLLGAGGIGKTRLGLQATRQLVDDFADGVCFVSLAPIRNPALVIPTIAQAFELKEVGEQSLLDLLKTSLRNKHLLLFLDNFEQIVTAAPLLSDLLVCCPLLKILLTSRAVLRIQGEYQYPVPPLAVPDLKPLPALELLPQYAAVELFRQRAQASKHDFQLTKANAHTIVEICAHLDGLPLAIEMAAARIKLLPPQALLARLSRRLAVLTSGARDMPARQQTLRNTIAWSYALLDPQEQRLFRWLSVFIGGCTLQAVETVCATLDGGDGAISVLDSVATLLDTSLLQQIEQEGEEPRLMMLETIREYGLESLAESGEVEAACQAHALYYLALTEEKEPQLDGPQQVTLLEQLGREYDNLRAAMRWSLEPDETGQRSSIALRLGGALRWFWLVRGHFSEGRNFLEQALVGREGTAASVRAKALDAAARLAGSQGNYEQQGVLCEESLALYRQLGDKLGMAHALFTLGGTSQDWGGEARLRNNLAAARTRTEEALALFKEVGFEEGAAWSLLRLARLASIQGEYAEVRVLFEENVALHRQLGNKRGISASLFRLAEVLFASQNDTATIRQLVEESLVLCQELKSKEGIAASFFLLGELALSQADVATARSLLEKSVALCREMGHRDGIAQALSALARVEVLQGNHVAVHTLYEESLAIYRALNNKEGVALCLDGLAGALVAQEEPAWAARIWGTAETLRKTIGVTIPPIWRAFYERSTAAARTQLGEETFAAAWAQGQSMTPEQALAPQGPATIPPPTITTKNTTPTYPAGLTAREVEVLRQIAQGLSNDQVAEQLVVSPRTVNWHLTSIYSKLQVSSRSAATRYAIEHKLV